MESGFIIRRKRGAVTIETDGKRMRIEEYIP